MSVIDRVRSAINGENGEAEKAGTRRCLMNRRQFLLSSGVATSVVMVGIPGMAEEVPAAVST